MTSEMADQYLFEGLSKEIPPSFINKSGTGLLTIDPRMQLLSVFVATSYTKYMQVN